MVTNLSRTVSERDLREHFSKRYSSVTTAKVGLSGVCGRDSGRESLPGTVHRIRRICITAEPMTTYVCCSHHCQVPVIGDENVRNRGIGFVRFADERQLHDALEKMHGTVLRGNAIKLAATRNTMTRNTMTDEQEPISEEALRKLIQNQVNEHHLGR
eukprot:GHVU01225601.1.p1 GENE.GHVU01225601.1~~GHVU01225601.1.p1  ORF type:complete len:157 (+),score=12.38 GHVU01225601.1:596-1066(+)